MIESARTVADVDESRTLWVSRGCISPRDRQSTRVGDVVHLVYDDLSDGDGLFATLHTPHSCRGESTVIRARVVEIQRGDMRVEVAAGAPATTAGPPNRPTTENLVECADILGLDTVAFMGALEPLLRSGLRH